MTMSCVSQYNLFDHVDFGGMAANVYRGCFCDGYTSVLIFGDIRMTVYNFSDTVEDHQSPIDRDTEE